VSDIELKISLQLTEGLIIRRLVDVTGEDADEALARELARELHAIIDAYRSLRSAQPPCEVTSFMDIERIEEADMIFTLLTAASIGGPRKLKRRRAYGLQSGSSRSMAGSFTTAGCSCATGSTGPTTRRCFDGASG
jgi:hypothetical protein